MFVFDINIEDLKLAIDNDDTELISKHLFRVQKISEKYYTFRFHLETQVDDKFDGVKNESLSIKIGKMMRITSLQNMGGIKVKINKLGKIALVENEKHIPASIKEKEVI
jgi:CRISPR-associated endonuclease Csn1